MDIESAATTFRYPSIFCDGWEVRRLNSITDNKILLFKSNHMNSWLVGKRKNPTLDDTLKWRGLMSVRRLFSMDSTSCWIKCWNHFLNGNEESRESFLHLTWYIGLCRGFRIVTQYTIKIIVFYRVLLFKMLILEYDLIESFFYFEWK